jgi:hypothetical protein
MSGTDLACTLRLNEKSGQRMNRIFRSLMHPLMPSVLPGVSEWDESVPLAAQWVLGGVSRHTRQCVLRCIGDRREDTMTPLGECHTGAGRGSPAKPATWPSPAFGLPRPRQQAPSRRRGSPA